MTLQIGDYVRLDRGWTRMVIIGETQDGRWITKYDNNQWSPVTQHSFEYPEEADGIQKREKDHTYGFVPWNGSPNKNQKWTLTMDYQVKDNLQCIGTKVGKTKSGQTILEFEDGSIAHFDENQLMKVVPYTVGVTGVGHSRYRCHYKVPQSADLLVGDMILSDSGNFYQITQLDTGNVSAKVFSGKKIITEEI